MSQQAKSLVSRLWTAAWHARTVEQRIRLERMISAVLLMSGE